MKSLKFIIVCIGITCFSFQNMHAQSNTNTQEEVSKVSVSDIPAAVKDVLKNYNGYEISKVATYQKKARRKGGSTYTFEVKNGNWTNLLVINEKGKIIEVKTGEGPK